MEKRLLNFQADKIEIPRCDSCFVTLVELDARLQKNGSLQHEINSPSVALLGIDNQGVPLLLRPASPDITHCLIAGTTGSGKTEFALFDPKGQGQALFANAPRLLFPVVQDSAETRDRICFLVTEMERRDRDLSQRPPVVIIIDELADLLLSCGRELQVQLTRLVQRGRNKQQRKLSAVW